MGKLQLIYKVGLNLTYDNLELSYDTFTEVAPGIMDRLIRSDSLLIPPFAKSMIQADKETLIHVRCLGGVSMPLHYHRESERIICLSGQFMDLVTGQTFQPGQVFEIEPFQSHSIWIPPGQDCEQIITLFPALPGTLPEPPV